MRSNEFLTERVLNLMQDDLTDKQKYIDEVWDILQRSYVKAGGFKTASSPEELIAKTGMWKLVTRDGHITAVILYRDQYGRKSVASGTDGSKQGIKDYLMVRDADMKLGRAWAEVSGGPESMMRKFGAKPIPSKFAQVLSRKQILSYNDDGFHYTRLIDGDPHEKIIYGTVNLKPEDIEEFEAAGIQLHELPHNLVK